MTSTKQTIRNFASKVVDGVVEETGFQGRVETYVHHFYNTLSFAIENSQKSKELLESVENQYKYDDSMKPFDEYSAKEQALILRLHTIHKNMVEERGANPAGLNFKTQALFFVVECKILGIKIGDELSANLERICADHLLSPVHKYSQNADKTKGKSNTEEGKEEILKIAKALEDFEVASEEDLLALSDVDYTWSLIKELDSSSDFKAVFTQIEEGNSTSSIDSNTPISETSDSNGIIWNIIGFFWEPILFTLSKLGIISSSSEETDAELVGDHAADSE